MIGWDDDQTQDLTLIEAVGVTLGAMAGAGLLLLTIKAFYTILTGGIA